MVDNGGNERLSLINDSQLYRKIIIHSHYQSVIHAHYVALCLTRACLMKHYHHEIDFCRLASSCHRFKALNMMASFHQSFTNFKHSSSSPLPFLQPQRCDEQGYVLNEHYISSLVLFIYWRWVSKVTQRIFHSLSFHMCIHYLFEISSRGLFHASLQISCHCFSLRAYWSHFPTFGALIFFDYLIEKDHTHHVALKPFSGRIRFFVSIPKFHYSLLGSDESTYEHEGWTFGWSACGNSWSNMERVFLQCVFWDVSLSWNPKRIFCRICHTCMVFHPKLC